MLRTLNIIFIVIIICFDYVWLGQLAPLWLFFALFIFITYAVFRRKFIKSHILKETVAISFFWILFALYALAHSLFMGLYNFDLQFILSFFIWGVFIVAVHIGTLISFRNFIFAITAGLLIHFAFSIGQVLSVDWAWDFPNKLMSFKADIERSGSAGYNPEWYSNAFLAYGRVKGSHFMIHVFASVIGPLTGYIFYMFFENIGSLPKRLNNLGKVLVLIGFITTILTFTRSVIYSLLIVIIVYFFQLNRVKRFISYLFYAFLIIVSFVLFNLGTFQKIEFNSFERLINFSNVSARNADVERNRTYLAAWEEIKSFPIFGGGGKNYHYHTAPHNIFLKITAYNGIIGLLLYLAAIGSFVSFGYTYWKNKLLKKWGIAFFVFLFLCLFNGLFHTNTLLSKSVFQPVFLGIIMGQMILHKHLLQNKLVNLSS